MSCISKSQNVICNQVSVFCCIIIVRISIRFNFQRFCHMFARVVQPLNRRLHQGNLKNPWVLSKKIIRISFLTTSSCLTYFISRNLILCFPSRFQSGLSREQKDHRAALSNFLAAIQITYNLPLISHPFFLSSISS